MAKPKKPKGKKLPKFRGEVEKDKHPISLLRGLGAGGLVFIFGGWNLIPYSFVAGVIAIYFGFLLLLLELLFDPWIIKNVSLLVNCVLFSIPLIFASLFTLEVVATSAPVEANSFAMRHHNYPSGIEIAGIAWHKNLTELTVVLFNPSDDNYKEFDLTIHPDKWVYKGALRDNPGCGLTPISGKHVLFTTTTASPVNSITAARAAIDGPLADVHDDAGDSWHRIASHDGYRLYCDRFPSKSTVQIIFALVSPNDSQPTVATVEWGSARVITKDYGKCDDNILNCFGDRPNPSIVKIDGTYKRKLRTIPFSRTVGIGNAD